ncbi:MAG TPA: sigma-70 family RNA polymerase sigma factor [Bacteroidales bacterium]|nr:sigma-70 family RNA polymerase sigma factor [Bacteroidales bacterium]HPS61749.1 sigma-70 family RNA polymerase sigma factor [Bacteroidales bacterium]
MKHYTDDELIEGLRGRETRCIDYLYREYFPVVRHHVQHNSGTVTDAEDLFQDALVALYHWSTSAAYHLNCSLKTYFMGIVKNLWRQRLDTKYRLCYSANLEVHEDRAGYSTFNDTVDADELEKERIFFKHLMNMPDDCRRLLQLFCLKVSLKEIARLLRYSDDEYVKTRKYLCKRMLRKRIMKDPEGKQYVSYERP